jgi:hypothetical protein
MNNRPSLKERVNQFNTLSLPGQPSGVHMGTSYLVNDLWKKILELEKQVNELKGVNHG